MPAGKRVLRLNPVLPTIKFFYADQDILKSKATQDAQAIRGAVEGAFKWKEGQNVPSHERLLEFFSTRVPRRDGKPGTVVGRDRGLQFYRLLQLVQDERGNKLTKKLQAEAERERELLDRTDPIAHIDLADEELAAIRAQTGGEVPARALAIISFEEGRLCLQRVGTSDKHAIAMAWKVAEKVTSPATTDTEHGPERPPMSKAEGAGGEGSTAPAAQSLEPDRFTEGEPQDTVPQPNTPANDVDHKSLRVGDRVSYKGVVGTLECAPSAGQADC
jgi:hypothetical protein